MKNLSEKAAIASFFTYSQFAISLTTGVVLFPLVVQSLGAYHYGLWLATGEAISYVLLGDLGVFAVLPWLVAASIGANDYDSLRRYLSNAIAIGFVIGALLISTCIMAKALSPSSLGVPVETWNAVFYPSLLLLVLNGIAYPFRAFNAVLAGAQDVVFGGFLSISQSLLTLALTVLMIVLDTGLSGLAVASGIPPLVISIFAFARTFCKHRYAIDGIGKPNFSGCRSLLREGLGAWLSGLGVKMMNASNGIIFAGVGRPDWATIYASTGKISQILTPLCATVPDSGLVGISQVKSSKDFERTKRSVVCLILLYTVIPSFAAIGLLALNPAFVSWWMGRDLYAGHYVNVLSAIAVAIAGSAGGMIKLTSVVGLRQTIGWVTVVSGLAYGLVGFMLVSWHGLVGLAEAALLVWSLILLPVGIYLISKIYSIKLEDFLAIGAVRWLLVTLLTFTVSAIIGIKSADCPVYAIIGTTATIAVYSLMLRPTLSLAPWPTKVRFWLCRLKVIPKSMDL